MRPTPLIDRPLFWHHRELCTIILQWRYRFTKNNTSKCIFKASRQFSREWRNVFSKGITICIWDKKFRNFINDLSWCFVRSSCTSELPMKLLSRSSISTIARAAFHCFSPFFMQQSQQWDLFVLRAFCWFDVIRRWRCRDKVSSCRDILIHTYAMTFFADSFPDAELSHYGDIRVLEEKKWRKRLRLYRIVFLITVSHLFWEIVDWNL